MFHSGSRNSSVGGINRDDGNWEVIDREEKKGSKPALENLVEAKCLMAVVRHDPPK